MNEKHKELVSIIIPCYNSGLFIADAINSVLNQTYKHIEIIVINDGSTDNSEEIIKFFSKNIIYISQENQGVSIARNNGYNISKGEYLCFMDADDWFYSNNIFDKMEYLKKNNGVSVVHSIVDITDDKLNSTSEYLVGMEGENLTQALLDFKLPLPCPSNIMMKKSVLEKVGLFDINLSTSADFDLWFRVCQNFKIGRISKLGIKYRQHSTNMFSNKDLYKQDMIYVYRKNFSLEYKWNYFLRQINYFFFIDALNKVKVNESLKYFCRYLFYSFRKLYEG